MIRDMLAMNLLGVVSDRPRIIEILHDMGVVHLHEEFAEAVPPETANVLKILRGKSLGLIEALGWVDWCSISNKNLEEKRGALYPVDALVLEGIGDSLDSFSARLKEQWLQKADLEGRLNSIRTALRTLSHFKTFIRENRKKGVVISIWWAQKSVPFEMISSIQKKIVEKNPLYERVSIPHHSAVTTGGEAVFAIAFSQEHQKEVKDVLYASECLPWLLPEEFERMRLDESIPLMELEAKEIPRRIGVIENNILKTRKLWGPKIGALYILLDEKIQQVIMEESSATTGEMFRIEGWVPLDEKIRLEKSFEEEFNGKVLLRWRTPQPNEWLIVPTALKNPQYFRPFELFLKLMPTLSYRGLDPTILIGIFFPFFSGCMIGDIGYGGIIFLIGIWLRKNKQGMLSRDIGSILCFTSIWSILWGLAFGELFGDLGHRLFHLQPLWLERSQVVLPVMAFTISLGFVHILIGFILGIMQGIKNGHRHIWIEKTGNVLILLAILSSMIIVKGWLPKQLFTITVTFLLIGIAFLLVGGGIGGLVESLGSIGNILSYVRIAAIGLSSAILAMVATSFVDSIGLSFIGIFLALTIHLLNFVLALAGSGLHAARLQYVEFLGKFYSGGGTPYKPFSRRKIGQWKKL